MVAVIRFAAVALLAGAFTCAGFAQDGKTAESPDAKKVYRNVPPEKVEQILKEMKIAFEKTKGKEAGIWFYDFEKNKFKLRLHDYQGKDLWIDARFDEKLSLEQINGWNVRAKFSRAVRINKNDKEVVSLESQLDCLGGTTDAIIRQFIERFDGEVAQFSKYLTKQ